ncbi:MAG TPA: SGNH/GDSL hydrolase family protein [Leptolyngbyaceae cyanobacterium]
MKIPAKYWIPSSVLRVLIVTDLTLRFAFGLGSPALVQADPYTGYRFQPNQKIFRFGKRIEYNQYSQRSKPITEKKTPGKLRILMVGDSVLNGGNPTDQSQIITELLEKKLTESQHNAEVLNASSGSWGIGNQLGYLREFGTFNADLVILQIGNHDLTQPTSTSKVVGHHLSFPNQRPLLASEEAWNRYIWPNLAGKLGLNFSPISDPLPPTSSTPDEQFKQNMESLKQIVMLVRSKNIPVFVLYTPNYDDLLPKHQILKYKPEFFRLLKTWKVPVIDIQTAWSNLPPTIVETYYRDWVHLNVPANNAIAKILFDRLCASRQLPSCSLSTHP